MTAASAEALDMAPLANLVREAMARHRVPGAAVGVITPQGEVCAGFGVGSVETQLAVDEATIFQCGSISKVYTATAVMGLVEQGRLALDAPVRTYLPEFRLADEGVAAQVTLRHLLIHTAGWHGDYIDDHGRGEDALARYVADFERLPQVAPLGRVHSYNNTAYALAGRLIEVVTGKPYEVALQELVLQPLGMHDTFFFARDVITRRFAVGHLAGPDGPRVSHGEQPFAGWELPGGSNPAGGVAPSIRDLLKLARFHLGDGTTSAGERLLSAETVAQMQAPQFEKGPASAAGEAMGFGWHLSLLDGERLVTHSGGTLGFISVLSLVPARGFAVAVLTNSVSAAPLLNEVSDAALQRCAGLTRTTPQPRPGAAAELTECAGGYLVPRFNGWSFAVDGDALVRRPLDAEGTLREGTEATPVRMQPFAADRFVDVDGPYAGRGVTDFLRDDGGRIGWVRAGARAFPRVP
jgi:CubicO group peptidase (beta-lactamase class C family)